jgi:hypothetical protein
MPPEFFYFFLFFKSSFCSMYVRVLTTYLDLVTFNYSAGTWEYSPIPIDFAV